MRSAAWFGVALALVGCGRGEESTYFVQVELVVGFPAAEQPVTLAWTDGADSATSVAGEYATIRISRGFATREEAGAFQGEFVVMRAGAELGRETVRFDACDVAATWGLPATRLTVIERQAGDASLSQKGVRCWVDPASATVNRDVTRRRARHRLTLPAPARVVTVTVDGAPAEAAGIELGTDSATLVLDVLFPEPAPDHAKAAMTWQAGTDAPVVVDVSFAPCLVVSIPPDDMALLTEQTVDFLVPPKPGASTTLGAGIDTSEGARCALADGSGWGWIP